MGLCWGEEGSGRVEGVMGLSKTHKPQVATMVKLKTKRVLLLYFDMVLSLALRRIGGSWDDGETRGECRREGEGGR